MKRMTMNDWYSKIIERQHFTLEDYVFEYSGDEDYRDYNLFFAIRSRIQDDYANENIVYLFDEYDILLRDYLYAHSGQKYVNPMLEIFLKRVIENKFAHDYDIFTQLAESIFKKYAYNWKKTLDAYLTDYKPLENYSMTETTIRDNIHTTTYDSSVASSGTKSDSVSSLGIQSSERGSTDTVTHATTDSKSVESSDISKSITNGNTDATTTNNVYGFNSASAVPTATASGTNTDSTSRVDSSNKAGTETLSKTGTDTDVVDETISSSTTDSTSSVGSTNETTAKTGDDTVKIDEEETLTRAGNIGVTTSQQMLQSELELRKYDLIERIFNDIDKELCLSCY